MRLKFNQRTFQLLLIILSAELIFILPFVLPRIFKPTFLKVFEINNLELGTCYSLYGIVALFSYLFGAYFADRFRPDRLMPLSLFLTSLGGFYLVTLPGYHELLILYAFWGFTTIFFFWASMIKATRIWGGEAKQGLAYSLLDSGRGMVSALVGIAGVGIFGLVMGGADEGPVVESAKAFVPVLILVSSLVLLMAVLSFLFMRTGVSGSDSIRFLGTMRRSLSNPGVLLLMFIVCSAYVGYKVTGNYALYASDVLKYNEVESAWVGSLVVYLRPIVALAFGLLSLRLNETRLMKWGFFLMTLGGLVFASGWIDTSWVIIFYMTMITGVTGVYGIRALYFSLVAQCKVPIEQTGTVVGLISIIGFTPDIFVGPWTGYLLDQYPGILGHQWCFLMLSCFSLLGWGCIWLFKRL
ncbi:MAG: MFS transporter [Bacteroidetes bacterium]|nr:MAG: MFS transporter [Bacteroidota bacterium]